MTHHDSEPVSASELVEWIRLADSRLSVQADWLTELDSAIGDADHGVNLARGVSALTHRLTSERAVDPESVLHLCGMTFMSKVGGAGGVLYGTLFREMARRVAGRSSLTLPVLAAATTAGVVAVAARGMAEVGDKTMIDALAPAAKALTTAAEAREPLTLGLERATAAAATGRDSTEPLIARRGRASYLGGRSAHHIDPGAASAALLVRALSDTLAGSGR